MSFFGTLSQEEQVELLSIARETLVQVLAGREPSLGEPRSLLLTEKAGAFVTLKKGGDLRGCIGNFSADTPLNEMVQQMAIAAALEDPRFESVSSDELPSITLEISVLSGLSPIAPEEVVVGTHGLFITLGFHRGVLLPQVPVEWGWERDEYLDHLCLKAGLPKGTWREPEVVLESFTAQVFSE